MNARQSFYSSVFEQINEYKRRRTESHIDKGFLSDHMIELGIFSAVLVVGVFGGFVVNVGNYFNSYRPVASRPQFYKFTQGSAADLYKAENSNASEETSPTESVNGTVVRPSDDGYVSADNPQRSFGYEGIVKIDNNPERVAYFKFSLPKTVTYSNATLKLYSRDKNTNGGSLYFVEDNLWSERLLTFDSRPNAVAQKVSDIGSVSAGGVVSVDVTPYVATGKVVTFMLSTDSDDGVDYSSKEDSSDMSPQLLLSE
jgi:hypothetical protein